ncbi:MAG: SDR family oxidoreductase [Dehalococcoidia bacterium]
MDLGLQGRTGLVTGGSKGIGRAIAFALAREGVDVAICARGRDDLQRTAQEIQKATGRRCIPIAADLKQEQECRRFVEEAVHSLGRADILVCSANEPGGGTFFTLSDQQWTSHMNLKFFSVVRTTRAVVPYMQQQRWGRIVIIAGMSARAVRPHGIDNGPVCAALSNFGKQLAQQVLRDGIRVNVLHPDITRTPRWLARIQREALLRGMSQEELEREEARSLPLGRLLEPEEIAHLAVFLCSPLADAIAGQSIAIDGGASLGIHY